MVARCALKSALTALDTGQYLTLRARRLLGARGTPTGLVHDIRSGPDPSAKQRQAAGFSSLRSTPPRLVLLRVSLDLDEISAEVLLGCENVVRLATEREIDSLCSPC